MQPGGRSHRGCANRGPHRLCPGQDNANVTLSTSRANETFFAMTKREPTLVEHLNNRSQPVLSVAGYGKMRPVSDNKTADGRATNRQSTCASSCIRPVA